MRQTTLFDDDLSHVVRVDKPCSCHGESPSWEVRGVWICAVRFEPIKEEDDDEQVSRW
jgi:hypothetical protein